MPTPKRPKPKNTDPQIVHLHGGVIYLSTILDTLMLALATNHVLPASVINAHMEAVSGAWGRLVDDPETAFPEALRDAQTRLAVAMDIFRSSMASLEGVQAQARAHLH